MSKDSNKQNAGGRPIRDVRSKEGFHDPARVSNDDVNRLGEFFPLSESGVLFRNSIERDVVGGQLLVGELSTNDSSQTIAYFASDVLEMPSFILQPESRSLYLFSKVLGLPSIDFESHPDFTRHYDLSATRPDHARLLFNEALLAYFADHHGLQVMSEGCRLIVFTPGKRFDGADLEGFIHQAVEVFTLLEEAAVEVRNRIADAPHVEPHEGAKQLPGLAGALVRRHLVTRRDLDVFLAQRPPRKVPANIRRQRLGSTSALFAFLGPLIGAGGLSVSITAGFLAGGGWNEERISQMIVGTVFALVGGVSGFFAWRYRIRNIRLLRQGLIALATIESVEATENYVGYDQRYRSQFRFEANGRQLTAHCKVGQRAAREAKQLADMGRSVRLLFDRDHPSRVLWAESLLTASDDIQSD